VADRDLIAEARDYAGSDEYGGAILLREIAGALESARREAWAEGYTAGHQDAARSDHNWPVRRPNPYREEVPDGRD